MKKIIVGIHGIKTHSHSWIDNFIKYCKVIYKNDDVLYVDYEYGYLPAVVCIIPFVKYYLVKKFKKKLRELCKKYPDASLNIIAHSYGTEKTHLALKTSQDDGKELIRADKVILIASILNIKTDLSELYAKRQFKEFHVYSSIEDEVCRFNPFGHSGYVGLYDEFATNHRFNELEHSDYFTSEFFDEWANILGLKEREL